MTREVVVDVDVRIHPLLHRRPQHAGPLLQLSRTVDLDARVVDDVAVRAHEPYVEQWRDRLRSESEHLFPRNPFAIAQRERDSMLGQQRQQTIVDPPALAKLDRDLEVAR